MSNTEFTLYAFPSMPGTFNMGPAAAKADILLQMAGMPFTTEMHPDYKAFSKGKLPVLKDGDTIIEDSEFIRLYLGTEYGKTLDAGLDDSQKAIGHALSRMLDERSYIAMVEARWVKDEGWAQIRPMFFAESSDEEAEGMRQQMREHLAHFNFSAHTNEEKRMLIREDMRAISALLGDKPFMMGDEPTYIDATIFGFLANFYASSVKIWLGEEVAAFSNLVTYIERGIARWYPNEGTAAVAAE
ncbi:MAG: glutathione S-transferase family protein [Kordiimonadaceae bacterium]|nr:glutathione S-transferase family protein [Kordiimonadaceae bacterium]